MKYVQHKAFHSEIMSLKKGKVAKNSHIIRLSPFLDTENILRVGGRLKNAQLSYRAKHQILLPKSHFITDLIVRQAHFQCLHGGPRLTEATVRQKYWVVNSYQTIRNSIKKCTICTRFNPKLLTQIMADIPAGRLQISIKPFTNCAVDYTGAINYKLPV